MHVFHADLGYVGRVWLLQIEQMALLLSHLLRPWCHKPLVNYSIASTREASQIHDREI